jgi:hypothetical protein
MVSAWPEPPSATSAAKSVGVRDGMEALAFAGIETPTERLETQTKKQAPKPGLGASEALYARAPGGEADA